MAQKNVVITIEADGEVLIEANNFQGVGCAAATKDLQKVLAGGGDVETKRKPDFYQSSTGKTTS
jgi:hypothetical protein